MAASYYNSGTHEVVDSEGNKWPIPYEDSGPDSPTEVRVQEFTVPVSGSGDIIIWQFNATGEQIAAFERMILIPRGGNLDVELVGDLGNEVGTSYSSLEAIDGAPCAFGPRIYANFTTDVFAGTADSVERVKVKNQSATDTVKLLVIIVDDT